MANVYGELSGYEHVNKDQRRKGGRMAKGKKVNMPGMSQHIMVNCNEAKRKSSQDKSSMRAGEKKDIRGRF